LERLDLPERARAERERLGAVLDGLLGSSAELTVELGAMIRQLERAANSAAPDPAYACNACGAQTQNWTPLCPHCRRFDALVWRMRPGEGAGADAEGGTTAFLPAAIDDQSGAVVGSAAISPIQPT